MFGDMDTPRPIRYDYDTWLCMRNDPVLPKAIIKRVHVVDKRTNQRVEKYRAVSWDLDPTKRKLIGYFNDVGAANEAVRYDIPGNVARVQGTKHSGCTPDGSSSRVAGPERGTDVPVSSQ